jgi:hypothetical protein
VPEARTGLTADDGRDLGAIRLPVWRSQSGGTGHVSARPAVRSSLCCRGGRDGDGRSASGVGLRQSTPMIVGSVYAGYWRSHQGQTCSLLWAFDRRMDPFAPAQRCRIGGMSADRRGERDSPASEQREAQQDIERLHQLGEPNEPVVQHT